jgi:hypothetical protein
MNVHPKNYLEYYTLRRDLDPPLAGVMDNFNAPFTRANPTDTL